MKCPRCGVEMVYSNKGRYECRNEACEVIEVRSWSGRRRPIRVVIEARVKK